MAKQIRVAIVDDSALMRQMLTQLLSADPEIEVVGSARDPYEARTLIKATNPDVITLDVEMPRMDGLTFLEKIMTLRPTPVIMVSTQTRDGSEATVRALELGAIDYVAKPNSGPADVAAMRDDLLAKVRMAATVRVSRRPALPARALTLPAPRGVGGGHLIAIGASTGGVERIREILSAMPANAPPIVIAQHMGASYLASFAVRLNTLCAPTVRLARDGDRLAPGMVLIAPGDRHLVVTASGGGLVSRLDDGPPRSGHRPSVDVLFESVAASAGARAVGAILSGMGRDGALGLKAVRDAGGHTIGEQETSCVVYGMPRAAAAIGAVAVELAIDQIAAELLRAPAAAGARDSPYGA